MSARLLAALLLSALPATAQQLHVHEGGSHSFPSRICSTYLGPVSFSSGIVTSVGGLALRCGTPLTSAAPLAAPVSLFVQAQGGQSSNSANTNATSGGGITITTGAAGFITDVASGTGTGGNGGDLAVYTGDAGDGATGSGTPGRSGHILFQTGLASSYPSSASAQRGRVSLDANEVRLYGALYLDSNHSQTYDGPIISITSDNQSITTLSQGSSKQNYTVYWMTSNDTTAANRTFLLPNPGTGNEGRVLVLYWASASNKGELADSGNVRLSAPWTGQTESTLTLLAVTSSVWVELARSAN